LRGRQYYSDHDGFVAYGDTDEAVKGADLVLDKARFAGSMRYYPVGAMFSTAVTGRDIRCGRW